MSNAVDIWMASDATDVARVGGFAQQGDLIINIASWILYVQRPGGPQALTTGSTSKAANVPAITDNTGGVNTLPGTLAAIAAGAAYAQGDMVAVKNAIAVLANEINTLRTNMIAANQLTGP